MGNVFIVDGVVKLGDSSSLVKLLSQISAHNRFAYTPSWRAPEQVYSVFRIKVVERGMESRLANLMLCLLIEKTIDGEDAVNKQRIEDVLNRIGNEELKEILREMLKLAPWERPSMDEALNRLLKVYQNS